MNSALSKCGSDCSLHKQARVIWRSSRDLQSRRCLCCEEIWISWEQLWCSEWWNYFQRLVWNKRSEPGRPNPWGFTLGLWLLTLERKIVRGKLNFFSLVNGKIKSISAASFQNSRSDFWNASIIKKHHYILETVFTELKDQNIFWFNIGQVLQEGVVLCICNI